MCIPPGKILGTPLLVTNGSGSGRPKNIRIHHNTGFKPCFPINLDTGTVSSLRKREVGDSNSNPFKKTKNPESNNHGRGTLFSVLKTDLFMNSTHLACPLRVRLKQPSLSPERESAPHCSTMALGWYSSITRDITGTKSPEQG
jgi:hypothetical protein